MRLMDLLRNRVAMVVLAAAVTLGLVTTGAVGLFNAMSAPEPDPAGQAPAAPPGDAASPVSAPAMDEMGKEPQGASYSDLGEQCPDVECVRVIGVSTADGGGEQQAKGSDEAAEAAVDKVFKHLLDDDWARVLPNNQADPDEVPLSESYLTNGKVMVTATPVDTPDAEAGLMVMHAQEPDS